MRIVLTLVAVAALAASCSKKAPEAPTAPGADSPATPTAPAPVAPPAAAPAAAAPSVAAPSVAPVPPPRSAEPPAGLSADEARELERRPGASPALVQRELQPAPAVTGLAGAPGPSPTAGPDDALVRLVVFSDFQCPVCRRAAEPVKQLRQEFGDDLQVIWKHNALTTHSRATPAALAAIAAQRQGKFWDYHDVMFQNSSALDDADLEAYATQIGLDLARFKRDAADPVAKAQVDYERALAEALGAPGTPSFFINGQKSVGWGSYFGLRSQVERAIAQARADVDAGTTARAAVAVTRTAATGDEGKKLAEVVFGVR